MELTQNNQWQRWVPPRLPHSFVATSEVAYFHYKVTNFYCPEDEQTTWWNDPQFAVGCLVETPLLSAKDTVVEFWHE